MKNKKKNTIITVVVVLFVLVVGLVLFLLNSSVVDTGLSVLEKKWVSDHANEVVNIKVYNNIPVFKKN